jgi:hypothetical protein
MEPKRLGVLCCANCGLEIVGEPVLVKGNAYCCGGCAHGGPCYCSYDPPEVDSLLPLRHQDGISNCRQKLDSKMATRDRSSA